LNSCAQTQAKIEVATEIHPESEPILRFEDEETLEDIFLKMHLVITQKISAPKQRAMKKTVTFEIISIVNTAEEFYLQGDTIEAIELLNEVEELLEQNN
jgi:hypothetical protein